MKPGMNHRYAARFYTPDDDALIQSMREAGQTWDAIGRRFGRTRGAIQEHAISAGLPCGGHRLAARAAGELSPRDLAGPLPLPAMHPLAWAVIALPGHDAR